MNESQSRRKRVGNEFEHRIELACNYYRRKGLANIRKTPEPFKVIGKDLKTNKLEGFYTSKAQVDFKGTLKGGRSIVFEAKQSSKDAIQQSVIKEQQWDDLSVHEHLGALCYVIVSLSLKDFYMVPWYNFRKMEWLYGHKHMNRSELEKFRIPPHKDGLIHFLEVI